MGYYVFTTREHPMTKTLRSQLITDTVRNMRRYAGSSISEMIPTNAATAAYIDGINHKQWAALKSAIAAEFAKQAAIDASNARIAAKLAARVSA